MKFENSTILLEQARSLIPSCAQTFSKNWTQYPCGVTPLFLTKADKGHVWDVDGNEYIDWPMALGPIILGHNHPATNNAVIQQIQRGVAFSLPHEQEICLARLLTEVIPCAEMVRFGKNGSDATSGAIRAARAYSGRDVIACCGYHGWQDWFIGTTTRNKGVPDAVRAQTQVFQYNDIDSLKQIFKDFPKQVAAVIMEPMGVLWPEAEYLEAVQDLTREEGALLIFDECWTGFRMSLGGAQEYFNITPDLACFGKAMGNGFPISAIVGNSEVMSIFDEIFFSFTFGGDMIGISAAIATITHLREKPILEDIWKLGQRLWIGVENLIEEFDLSTNLSQMGYGPRSVMTFTHSNGKEWLALKTLCEQEAIQQGVLFGGYHVVTAGHTIADIDFSLKVYREVFKTVKDAIERNEVESSIQGRMVQPVFRNP